MPKLQDQTVRRNQHRIEAGALRVFTRQGFHGTSVRDIARAAGVSLGNLYNYYPTKERIFRAVVEGYETKMAKLRGRALAPLHNAFSPAELHRMSRTVRQIVYGNPDYWRLMYIDVIEFGNRHFAHTFRHLAANMERQLGQRLNAAARHPGWSGVDPALAFTAIYLQIFTYFLVEKLFGGRQHLGVSDKRAVEQLVRMYTQGLWRTTAPNGRRKRRSQ